MIKVFRNIRRKLFAAKDKQDGLGKLSKYILYAVGEIVLVVIGILIAVQINNWNEKSKEKEKLRTVYSRIIVDIDNNLEDVNKILSIYEMQKPIFESVLKDSVTPDLLAKGLQNLITNLLVSEIEKTGVNQLRNLNRHDSLDISIIRVFDRMSKLLESVEHDLTDDVTGNLKDWRDKYVWFPDFLLGKRNEEMTSYFLESSDYRNRVSYHYIYAIMNHKSILEKFRDEIKKLQLALKKRVKNG